MAESDSVNVWFDQPGDFLEICWGRGQWAVDGCEPADAEFGLTVHLTAAGQSTGLDIIGPVYFSEQRCAGKSSAAAPVQPHPVTVAYDQGQDLWQIQWGPAIVDCLDTPNPRIRARVDAAGHIQGLEIRDLRTFDAEILNQDLRPAELGVKTG